MKILAILLLSIFLFSGWIEARMSGYIAGVKTEESQPPPPQDGKGVIFYLEMKTEHGIVLSSFLNDDTLILGGFYVE